MRLFVYIFCLLTAASGAFWFSEYAATWQYFLQPEMPSSSPCSNRKQKLADGCYHVFLDVGANVGVHGRFLYEPEQYPLATVAQPTFDKAFGHAPRNNSDICIFAFEPNPRHALRLTAVRDTYNALGWRYHFLSAGVSDHDGNLTFYRMNDERQKEWGFNAVRKTNMRGQKGIPVANVPIVRLATWIQREIQGRQIPIRPNATKPPTVVMKMDVEGLEMAVLPDLFFSGVFCNVLDIVMGEAHFQWGFYPMTLHNNVTLRHSQDGQTFVKTLQGMLKVARNCNHTVWITEDDESYLQDGVPFPNISARTSSAQLAPPLSVMSQPRAPYQRLRAL